MSIRKRLLPPVLQHCLSTVVAQVAGPKKSQAAAPAAAARCAPSLAVAQPNEGGESFLLPIRIEKLPSPSTELVTSLRIHPNPKSKRRVTIGSFQSAGLRKVALSTLPVNQNPGWHSWLPKAPILHRAKA